MEEITRIDPALPLCWEDADTVRIGFESAHARIHNPVAAVQRLLGALCTGIPTQHLHREARRFGASPQELETLLSDLKPALITVSPVDAPPTHPSAPLRIVIADRNRAIPGLVQVLSTIESCVITAVARPEECDLVVHVERFLEPLERAQRWRSFGLPHLLVRFSDRSVRVGPIILASGVPCHSCISLALVAQDRALPLLAMQLHDKVPSSETTAAGEIAAIYAAQLIREWRRNIVRVHNIQWVIPIVQGQPAEPPQLITVAPHSGCSCEDALDASFEPSPRSDNMSVSR